VAGLYEGIEEAAFKPVPGGYIFQSRNPWFFGPSHRYRVNEIEEAQIADCIRETLRRIKRFVFIMMVVIPLALVAGIFWLAAQGMATVGPVLLYALALFVPYYAAIHIYSTRRLRPLIAGLPRTTERITISEGSRSFASTASTKLLTVMIAGPALGFVSNAMILIGATLDGRPIHNLPTLVFGITASLLATGYFVFLMIMRFRQKRIAA
jgi:hypothetical protein